MASRKIAEEVGYDSIGQLMDSLIHPKNLALTTSASGVAATAAFYFEKYMGITAIVAAAILMLFVIEMTTGIKASKKEGKSFSSKKFGSGILKMGIYYAIIGLMHIFAGNIEPKPIFGWQFNIYEWLHYFFLNFVILQMVISNLENFARLGWGEMIPAINKINGFIGIKVNKDTEKESK